MVKVLVTGANGQLGQALRKADRLFPDINLQFFDSASLDITDSEQVQRCLDSNRPHYVINTAAYTAVDKAETEPDRAYAVNAEGAANLALACKDYDSILVHISTDFVFDGTAHQPYSETDTTGPQGVYGASKLKGEEEIARLWERHFIIRTSWLYSEFGHNFLKTMLRLGGERTELGVVDDQIGTPTNANDLAGALLHILQTDSVGSDGNHYGLYHYSNTGSCSWYGFAKAIFSQSNIGITVNPIPTSAYPTPAKRPSYSVLDTTKIKQHFGLTIPAWEESLARVLEALS